MKNALFQVKIPLLLQHFECERSGYNRLIRHWLDASSFDNIVRAVTASSD